MFEAEESKFKFLCEFCIGLPGVGHQGGASGQYFQARQKIKGKRKERKEDLRILLKKY